MYLMRSTQFILDKDYFIGTWFMYTHIFFIKTCFVHTLSFYSVHGNRMKNIQHYPTYSLLLTINKLSGPHRISIPRYYSRELSPPL
jgi:hypothetical protein